MCVRFARRRPCRPGLLTVGPRWALMTRTTVLLNPCSSAFDSADASTVNISLHAVTG